MWDPKSPWADQRVRRAVSRSIGPAISEAETLGASPPTGNMVPKAFEHALPMDLIHMIRQAKKLLAEAGYQRRIRRWDLYPWPPYFSTGEAIIGYLRDRHQAGCARWSVPFYADLARRS